MLSASSRNWIAPGYSLVTACRIPRLARALAWPSRLPSLAVDAQCLLQGPGRARIIPGQQAHAAQVTEGVRLAETVAEVLRGAPGGDMAGDGLGPRAVLAQQGREAGGEGDNAGVLARSRGVVQAGEQADPLGPGPGQRLRAVEQIRDRGRRGQRGLDGDRTSLVGQRAASAAAAC